MQNTQNAEEMTTFDFDDENDSSVDVTEEKSSEVVSDAVAADVSDETRTIDRESDDELENYSENVQKRINQLTAKRKQALEEAQAAYQYAEQMKQQNDQMQKRLAQLDQGYISEYSGRVETQAQNAEKLYADAMEAGDYKKAAEAQNMMASLAIEKERIRLQKARQEEQAAAPEQEQMQQQPVRQAQQPAPIQDPKLEAWLGRNEWFKTNKIMNAAAKAIHEQLVLDEGFDPSTDEYYAEIDKRIRAEFPQKFQEKRQNAQAVAPASNGRSATKSGRKKTVELTPGQVAFAKKMKIPLEVYAKEVAKIEQRNAQ